MYNTLKQIAEDSINGDIVAEYIKNNDKKLVPKILQLIESNPDFKQRNNELKNSAGTLYRGIALDEDLTDDEVIAFEKKQAFVATSRSEQVAKDYAKGKDIVNGKRGSNPVKGIVFTYEVTNEDVVFDLATFDKEHGSLETLIRPKNAKLVKLENVIWD